MSWGSFFIGLAVIPGGLAVWMAHELTFQRRKHQWETCMVCEWGYSDLPSGRSLHPKGVSRVGNKVRWWRHERTLRHRAYVHAAEKIASGR